MATEAELRPIYEELKGYLSEAPGGENGPVITDSGVWEPYHQTIDELNRITGAVYNKHRVNIKSGRDDRGLWQHVNVSEYRSKISGLIGRLHAEFFQNEREPFAGGPALVFNQVQQQTQAVHIQIAVELTEHLTRKEQDFKEGTQERTFIDRAKGYLKSAMSGATSMAQLMAALLKTARECGLSIDDMWRVLGG